MSSASTSASTSAKTPGLLRRLTASWPLASGQKPSQASNATATGTEETPAALRQDFFKLERTCETMSCHAATRDQVAGYRISDAAQRKAKIAGTPAEVEYIAFDSLTPVAQALARKMQERDELRDRIERLAIDSDEPVPLDPQAAAARDAELLSVISRSLSNAFMAKSPLIRPDNEENLKASCGRVCHRIATQVMDPNHKVELFGQLVSHLLAYAEPDSGYQSGMGHRLQVVSGILDGLIKDFGDAAGATGNRDARVLHAFIAERVGHIASQVDSYLAAPQRFVAPHLTATRQAINELRQALVPQRDLRAVADQPAQAAASATTTGTGLNVAANDAQQRLQQDYLGLTLTVDHVLSAVDARGFENPEFAAGREPELMAKCTKIIGLIVEVRAGIDAGDEAFAREHESALLSRMTAHLRAYAKARIEPEPTESKVPRGTLAEAGGARAERPARKAHVAMLAAPGGALGIAVRTVTHGDQGSLLGHQLAELLRAMH